MDENQSESAQLMADFLKSQNSQRIHGVSCAKTSHQRALFTPVSNHWVES